MKEFNNWKYYLRFLCSGRNEMWIANYFNSTCNQLHDIIRSFFRYLDILYI